MAMDVVVVDGMLERHTQREMMEVDVIVVYSLLSPFIKFSFMLRP
jgi:hypothetical protein